MMPIRTIRNTIIQVNVPNHFHGRVIGIYVLVLTATLPIGSLLVSVMSQYIGVQTTALCEGIITLIIALFYGRYLKKVTLKKAQVELLDKVPEEDMMQA